MSELQSFQSEFDHRRESLNAVLVDMMAVYGATAQDVSLAIEGWAEYMAPRLFSLVNEMNAIMAPFALKLPDPQVRFEGEHPVDWVLRVGRETSGHNIYEGEAWRFRVLRDWWQGDDVDDEYGKGWKR